MRVLPDRGVFLSTRRMGSRSRSAATAAGVHDNRAFAVSHSSNPALQSNLAVRQTRVGNHLFTSSRDQLLRLGELLAGTEENYLFGGSSNLFDLMGLFDRRYYLRADEKLVVSRLEVRQKSGQSYHGYGETEQQRRDAAARVASGESRARAAGFDFIDATFKPEQVFAIVCH